MFEKLRGNLAGFHSIRVNDQWRLIFRWDGGRGEAEGVYLDDHSASAAPFARPVVHRA
jgi:toxin HigB-1